MLSFIYKIYIEWVAHTSHIIVKGVINKEALKDSVIGFWHGDSFGVYFLLRELQKQIKDVYIIVTADKRGDYIENILEMYGASAIRVKDGAGIRDGLKEIMKTVKRSHTVVGVTLDGPLGPLHDPKKLGCMLANAGNKTYLLIKVEYTKKIRLTRRWDNYVIPLPFGRITFTIYNEGNISKEVLKNFTTYKQHMRQKIL